MENVVEIGIKWSVLGGSLALVSLPEKDVGLGLGCGVDNRGSLGIVLVGKLTTLRQEKNPITKLQAVSLIVGSVSSNLGLKRDQQS